MKVESNFEIRIQLDDAVKLNGRSIILSAPQARQLNIEIERELKYAPAPQRARNSAITDPQKLSQSAMRHSARLKRRAMRARLIRNGIPKPVAVIKAQEYVAGTFDGDVDKLKSELAAAKPVVQHYLRGRLSNKVVAEITAALGRGVSHEDIRKQLNVSEEAIKRQAERLAAAKPAQTV